MNCPDWEERIALYAEGDLPPREAQQAAAHVADCEACRGFAEEIRHNLAALREFHAEPPAPADYAAVRARVLAELPGPRRSWRWVWLAPVLAAAIAIAFFVTTPQPVEPPHVAVARSPAPPIEIAAPPAPPRRVLRAHRKPKPRRPAEPLVVKLITDDPNVVIYWIAN